MKIDKILKRLENIEIDGNIGEIRKIAEYITQTFSERWREYFPYIIYFMMNDKSIYNFSDYRKLLESNKISLHDTYVYARVRYYVGYNDSVSYFYPLLDCGIYWVKAYLSKLGFDYDVEPAPGLKYFAVFNHFTKIPIELTVNHVVVEIVDLDTVAINMNLPPLIRGVLGTKYDTKNITFHEIEEITLQLYSRKLFAGYDFMEAEEIIRKYYEDHDTSLANDVVAINYAYNYIFQPYHAVYNLKNGQFVTPFKQKLLKHLFSFSHGRKNV